MLGIWGPKDGFRVYCSGLRVSFTASSSLHEPKRFLNNSQQSGRV